MLTKGRLNQFSLSLGKADQYAEQKGKLMKGLLFQMFGEILGIHASQLPKLIW